MFASLMCMLNNQHTTLVCQHLSTSSTRLFITLLKETVLFITLLKETVYNTLKETVYIQCIISWSLVSVCKVMKMPRTHKQKIIKKSA